MKKVKLLIIVIIIIMAIYILNNTYSKYTDTSNAKIQSKVGEWHIKVNDTDITSVTGEPVEFVIDNFNWNTSSHVADKKVAPGMKGSFELTLDPEGTDTSIKYVIRINNSKFTESNDINLKIKKVTINDIEYEYEVNEIEPEDSTEMPGTEILISQIKLLDDIKSSEDVRIDNIIIEAEWENNEENNAKDSELGSVPGSVISLPITIDVIQYTGEELEP